MPFLNDFKTRLSAFLVQLMRQGTTALGRCLSAMQRVLAWLDGQHPVLAQCIHVPRLWLTRHPKTISATVASVLLAGGGGAFAVANLGPDIADQPVVSVTTPLSLICGVTASITPRLGRAVPADAPPLPPMVWPPPRLQWGPPPQKPGPGPAPKPPGE